MTIVASAATYVPACNVIEYRACMKMLNMHTDTYSSIVYIQYIHTIMIIPSHRVGPRQSGAGERERGGGGRE